jgi:thiazole synthase
LAATQNRCEARRTSAFCPRIKENRVTDTEIEAFGSQPWLRIGQRQFHSRLLLGVEQYTEPALVRDVLAASGADVFITTYDLERTRSSLLLSDLDREIDLDTLTWIGTTSFSHSAVDAVGTARQLRATLGLDIIKLDVRDGDNRPDAQATILAAKELLNDGFSLLPFLLPDIDNARVLEGMGCSALRLMAAPVGSYRGLVEPERLRACIDAVDIPTVVEGGLGSPADVTRAFELGADAVLVNTLVARATDPVRMARAVRYGALAGGLVRAQ